MGAASRRRTYRGRTLEEAASSLPSRQMRGERRRSLYLGIGVVVLLIGAGAAYAVVSASSSSSGGGGQGPAMVSVTLGTPISSHIACLGNNGTMIVERVAWLNSTAPVRTNEFRLEVQEIGDGDVIGADNAPSVVTASNLCFGNSQPYVYDWYGVLQSPNGTNLATYTYASGWQALPPYTLPLLVAANSTVVVVSTSAFIGLGYALEVLPFGNGPIVNGFTAL